MAQIGTNILTAKSFLDQEQVVAIPTETVYGLAGNALKEESVLKIFEVKNRPAFDPLIVHVAKLSQIEAIAKDIPDIFYRLFKSLSPGPITYILKKKDVIPDLVTSGHSTVGIRVPNHPLTLNLLESLNFPLAAPSANPFGFVSPTSASHVDQQLGDKIPYILDGGECEVGLESTIIDLTQEKPRVLRMGGLTLEELENILEEPILDIKTSSSNPNAPGMLISHYSPGCPLKIGNITDLVQSQNGLKFGILDFHSSALGMAEDYFDLSADGDLHEAARNLFTGLRHFANRNLDVVYTNLVPNKGLGRAINDRLKRAAATTV